LFGCLLHFMVKKNWTTEQLSKAIIDKFRKRFEQAPASPAVVEVGKCYEWLGRTYRYGGYWQLKCDQGETRCTVADLQAAITRGEAKEVPSREQPKANYFDAGVRADGPCINCERHFGEHIEDGQLYRCPEPVAESKAEPKVRRFERAFGMIARFESDNLDSHGIWESGDFVGQQTIGVLRDFAGTFADSREIFDPETGPAPAAREAIESVKEDRCPKCGGELDTGWECNQCGFDAVPIAEREDAGKHLPELIELIELADCKPGSQHSWGELVTLLKARVSELEKQPEELMRALAKVSELLAAEKSAHAEAQLKLKGNANGV
jgi:hypothetical protein